MRHEAISAEARLWTARVVGGAAMGILGQLAVDMPDGYFGRFDETTSQGWWFVGFILTALAACVPGLVRGKAWAVAISRCLLVAIVAAFLPAVAADPVIAGAVVAWQLVLLSRSFFPTQASPFRAVLLRRLTRESDLETWLELDRPAAQHLLIVSTLATVAVVGFRVGHRLPALTVCAALALGTVVLSLPLVRLALRAGSRLPYLLVIPLLGAFASLPDAERSLLWIGAVQSGLLAMLLARSQVTEDLLDLFFRRPALLIAASFVCLIAVGTLLLSFPASAAGDRPIAPLDAVFTATSAACVTGLVVVDTPTAFSSFGHVVILLLIQVGGLNIMVLSGFAALLLGKGLGVRGERALGDVLDLPTARSAQQLAVAIVLTTLAIEVVGAALLAIAFSGCGLSPGNAGWRGLFHSVSAFCNAGFALQSDSLTLFQQKPLPLLVVASLITLGGLGFATLGGVWRRCRGSDRRLTTQARLVLIVSAALVVTGTMWFATAEWRGSLAGLAPADKWVNALFQSVTTRTAGFSSVDFKLLHPSSVLMIIVWMFVGASPGGTGGGVKTTTLAVLMGAIGAISRGRTRVVLLGRTIGAEVVLRSVAITVIAALVSLGALVAMVSTQDLTVDGAAFEVVSALGTVGLSLGGTERLDDIGKLIITVVMFVGRIGPLTLALMLARSAARRVEYPEDRIMVG